MPQEEIVMGFKCPICFKDFGTQKNKWKNHIEKAHNAIAKDIVNLVTKITQTKRNKEKNK